MGLTIRFWGVRGSIASAGASTATVGGNTSCVEVRAGGDRDGRSDDRSNEDEQVVILDAGTGLRPLGADLASRARASGRPLALTLLLSHLHWDHIQGFPFFAPAYAPGAHLDVVGPAPEAGDGVPTGDLRAALAAQMRPPHFPVGLDALRADLRCRSAAPGEVFQFGAVRAQAAAASHPNGCLAWRLEHAGRSLVYATDTEHSGDGTLDPHLVALARRADVLVYDAQYTPAEWSARRGWGHSTAEEGARIATAAGVGQLVLFHHDPAHDDGEVARIEGETRRLFPRTVAAREGLTLTLDDRYRDRRAA